MTTGIDWLDKVLLGLAIATAVLTPLAVVLRVGRPLLKGLRNFLEDWSGEPERPGVAGKPGVMERLVKIERELKPNGGSSMRDGLDRIEADGQATAKALAEHITASESDRAEVRTDLAALTRTTAGLVHGQGQQDEVIANLSKALKYAAASTPPAEEI